MTYCYHIEMLLDAELYEESKMDLGLFEKGMNTTRYRGLQNTAHDLPKYSTANDIRAPSIQGYICVG